MIGVLGALLISITAASSDPFDPQTTYIFSLVRDSDVYLSVPSRKTIPHHMNDILMYSEYENRLSRLISATETFKSAKNFRAPVSSCAAFAEDLGQVVVASIAIGKHLSDILRTPGFTGFQILHSWKTAASGPSLASVQEVFHSLSRFQTLLFARLVESANLDQDAGLIDVIHSHRNHLMAFLASPDVDCISNVSMFVGAFKKNAEKIKSDLNLLVDGFDLTEFSARGPPQSSGSIDLSPIPVSLADLQVTALPSEGGSWTSELTTSAVGAIETQIKAMPIFHMETENFFQKVATYEKVLKADAAETVARLRRLQILQEMGQERGIPESVLQGVRRLEAKMSSNFFRVNCIKMLYLSGAGKFNYRAAGPALQRILEKILKYTQDVIEAAAEISN